MQCPRCRHENPAPTKFCGECGASLAAVCPSCGAPRPVENKFCGGCGARLWGPGDVAGPRTEAPVSYTPEHLAQRILTSRGALPGERKQVTVLFADLKGSLELLANRDPEEARQILDPVLELMMEAVHRYEGTVNQVMGDGIMALFGAPLALEEHAVRACYAALRMQDRVRHYGEDLQRSHGVPVQMRVGLNSGEVVVRSIGSDLRMDYTAVGQTTHLAARMEQMARPGTSLLTASTLRLAEGFVQARHLGPLAVKGLEARMDVYELTGADALHSRLRAAAARGLARFVGRDAELAELQRALDRARQGHGQVVAVVGEPGVGKSRLVHEFVHSQRTQGWLALEASSVSYGKTTPYLPVIEFLRGYFQIEASDGPERARERVMGKVLALDEQLRATISPILSLLEALPDEDPFRGLGLTMRRGLTIGALKQLVLRESLRQPLCLLFEDLHWIDSESEVALDFLIESLPASRVLLLVSYRPGYEDRWASKTYHSRLRVDPLPSASADELLGALLGEAPRLRALKTLLKERTGGNPYFLEESVRSLAEAGILAGEPGAYRLTGELGEIQVPPTVQALLAARIDRLPPEDKRLLQCASVVGTDIPFSALEGVSELPDGDLQRGLARLRASELLYETRLFPEAEYAFKHALVHDVAYASLLHDRRRTLHRRVGEIIEQREKDRLTELAEILGNHFERGEVWENAARHYLAAAERARERFAYAAGLQLCERALGCADRSAGVSDERMRGLVLRGDLASLLDDLPKANGSYDRALDLVRDPEQRRWIESKRHRPRVATRDGARLAYYEHGSGEETLFLVNPLIYGLAMFQPIVEPLCQDFRIITMDCRGTGDSDPLERPYSIRQHMEDARAVLEAVGGGPVVGIGISRGGNLLLHLAVAYPHLVSKLVTVGTSLSWTRPHARHAQELVDREGVEAALRFWFQIVWTEPGLDALVEQMVQARLLLPRDTLLSFFDPDPHYDLGQLLRKVRVPTLVTRGTADRASGPEDARVLTSEIPDASLYEFHGRCHVPIFTATREFCEVLRHFVRTGSVPRAQALS
jgi:class 3 adenylate cyclase/pimeloyl-ACP methyl ester carboxylesterase